jgi:hypothetical protein
MVCSGIYEQERRAKASLLVYSRALGGATEAEERSAVVVTCQQKAKTYSTHIAHAHSYGMESI